MPPKQRQRPPGPAEDTIGFSDEQISREDSEDALLKLLASGDYKEMLADMKANPDMAKEMEKNLADSGMSWDDLAESLDRMAGDLARGAGGRGGPAGPPGPFGPSGPSKASSSANGGASASKSGPSFSPSGPSKPSTSAASPSASTAPGKARAAPPPSSVVVTPIPAYVVKSHNRIATPNYPADVKVFINVCHSPDMFAPPPLGSVTIRQVVQGAAPFEYRVPIAVGPPRAGLDKAGRSCVEVDACMHSSVVELAEKDVEYQAFLSEIVVENVEEQHGLALSRDFAFPKMRAKGVVGKITVAPPSSSKPASKPAPKPSPASPPSGPRIVELEDDEPPKTAKGKEPAQPKSILKPTAPPPPADKGEPAREKVAEKQPAAKPAVAEKIAEREPPKAVAGTIREREAPKAVAETIREREPPRPALDRAGEPERPPTAPIAATRPPPPANGINGHAGPPAEAAPAPEEPRHIVRVTGTAPKRMVAVEIELPGMTTLASAALDVSRDAIAFEVPEKYRLRVKLPVSVDFADEAKGRAVFDRSAKKLVVTLEESE